jgi:hypothetical protein
MTPKEALERHYYGNRSNSHGNNVCLDHVMVNMFYRMGDHSPHSYRPADLSMDRPMEEYKVIDYYYNHYYNHHHPHHHHPHHPDHPNHPQNEEEEDNSDISSFPSEEAFTPQELVSFAQSLFESSFSQTACEGYTFHPSHHPAMSYADWVHYLFQDIHHVLCSPKTIVGCRFSGQTKWGPRASLMLIREAGGNITGTDYNAFFIPFP